MKLTVALDWTPNVIHAGMYLAHLNGYFKKLDLEVTFIPTDVDNYTKKPVERLISGEAHVALGPSEHLISYRLLQKSTTPITAVATIMQEETSAFVTLASSGIDRPAQLDGKTYAGYKTVLEENLLNSMIQNDGGQGDIQMVTPPRLEIFDAFLKEQFDVCWVFLPWEGVIAQQHGTALNTFRLNDYQVPYGYSPLLMVQEEMIAQEGKALQAFLTATAQGYRETSQHPNAVAKTLTQGIDHANFQDLSFITQAMQTIAPTLLNTTGAWGIMQQDRWESYLQWLSDHQLLKTENGQSLLSTTINPKNLFTNQFL